MGFLVDISMRLDYSKDKALRSLLDPESNRCHYERTPTDRTAIRRRLTAFASSRCRSATAYTPESKGVSAMSSVPHYAPSGATALANGYVPEAGSHNFEMPLEGLAG